MITAQHHVMAARIHRLLFEPTRGEPAVAAIDLAALRETVADRVAEAAAYEDRFWDIVDNSDIDRTRASRMLDVAVEWIGTGRGDVVDPYALALSWMPA
ncbi:hypothetical protein SAMN05192558_102587 [Actinokineospora alba]|uniref:Uncharacterized protein n=1 Tax=Actinokineospora alba TaxID=504798 RepID=A0A1H0IJK8_9PSEU|nr:hypothetical protein [Actinokineospora alba]TDP70915.1 hypothetical protein C8E96_6547 [Actinokineospora alba]SDI90171.1 hypothetical protein SAMN05421871_108286 [Actinokineospora alba]SDO31573.1 hypothetical protein SAMN05192558_102587 [Actinokineospora alba]